jgi:hypothetical protein
MASAPQQQQTQAERDEIKLGQDTTKRAREKSAPLLAGYQKKMNRDDSGRLAGMSSADVMQAAGTDRSGQLLAAGQGGGHASTQLGAQLQQTADNSSMSAMDRQDALKSSYNDLGNEKNMDYAAGVSSLAGNASRVARASADATAMRQNAMVEGLTNVAAAKGLSMKDTYDTNKYNLKRGIKQNGGYSGPFETDNIKSLRQVNNNTPGKGFFDKYWSN